MGQHLAGVAHEGGEQAVLDGRHVDVAVGHRDVAAGQVDLQLADAEDDIAVVAEGPARAGRARMRARSSSGPNGLLT